MTSNLGATYLNTEALATREAFDRASKQVMEVVQSHFRPEFLNRVDDIIIFRPLEEAQLIRIVDLQLANVRKLLADRRISIEVTSAAKELIFKEGYDRVYGARPLKRAIQRLVQDPLAMKILDGDVLHGDHVVIDADRKKDRLTFEVERSGKRERSAQLETVESPS
jgi:ATP-dependent Clp protease ATP-binding subunit ClpB